VGVALVDDATTAGLGDVRPQPTRLTLRAMIARPFFQIGLWGAEIFAMLLTVDIHPDQFVPSKC
jgi:hypothetical protein